VHVEDFIRGNIKEFTYPQLIRLISGAKRVPRFMSEDSNLVKLLEQAILEKEKTGSREEVLTGAYDSDEGGNEDFDIKNDEEEDPDEEEPPRRRRRK